MRFKLICFTLFAINGLHSCSTESVVKREAVSSLSSKKNVSEEKNKPHVASAEELKLQFHGCKAHQ